MEITYSYDASDVGDCHIDSNVGGADDGAGIEVTKYQAGKLAIMDAGVQRLEAIANALSDIRTVMLDIWRRLPAKSPDAAESSGFINDMQTFMDTAMRAYLKSCADKPPGGGDAPSPE